VKVPADEEGLYIPASVKFTVDTFVVFLDIEF